MKKIMTLLAMFLMFGGILMAQTPKFNYQAVLRHSTGHDQASELVRFQSGNAYFSVGEVALDTVEFTTNENGMTSVWVECPRNYNWNGEILTATFAMEGDTITINTPVTPVPYAIQAETAHLSTPAIVTYLDPDNTDYSDMNRIFAALRANSDVHDAIRDTVVEYIKDHLNLVKRIAFRYMHEVTTSDLDEAYAIGQSMDPEVKSAIYNLVKRYLNDNRQLVVDVAKYYIQEATVDELSDLHETLRNNTSASRKVIKILDNYFDDFMENSGLNCGDMTPCNISDMITE